MRKYLLIVACFFMALHGLQAQLKTVDYTEGSDKLHGFAMVPKKAISGRPGILILPAWKGIDNHSKEVAAKLAEAGYHSFIADIYGEGNVPTNNKEAGERAGFYKKNIDKYQARIKAALQQLIVAGCNAEKVVVIGYCFGGTGALEAARSQMPIQGVVSFHGGLGRDSSRTIEPIKSKILVCHGADDPYVPVEEVAAFQNEMRTAKADWQMVYYADAVHAFTEISAGNDNSKGAAYNEKADKRSWQHLMDFLNETLK